MNPTKTWPPTPVLWMQTDETGFLPLGNWRFTHNNPDPNPKKKGKVNEDAIDILLCETLLRCVAAKKNLLSLQRRYNRHGKKRITSDQNMMPLRQGID